MKKKVLLTGFDPFGGNPSIPRGKPLKSWMVKTLKIFQLPLKKSRLFSIHPLMC
ncbi:hypothetical protein QKW52_15720 [Bacillus sonorensis]|nr:hypothetical protein [Bacillus sonorensis]